MAGTWTEQNKILPGAYLNFRTNVPLSITPGERGTVVLMQEMSVGSAGNIYKVTAEDTSKIPKEATAQDKLLINEALKGAKTVLVYNLGTEHDAKGVTSALEALRTVQFNTLAYPYVGDTYTASQAAIKAWVENMREHEGVKIQAVLGDMAADSEAVLNVGNGVKLADGTVLSPAQCTAWVAGATAGANINKSNTNQKYPGAIDVEPRLTKTEMEDAITNGKFIFKVDTAQNVTVVYDINSLTTTDTDKGKMYQKNRVIRTIDGINNDITQIFEANFIGKINNNAEGRSQLRAVLIQYFNTLQQMNAIQNFTAEDVTVEAGKDSDSVLIECNIQPIDSVEKIYMSINLS